MPKSKVKSTKQARRLKARQEEWDKLHANETRWEGTVKIVHKPCGAVLGFTKPGSNKK